MKCSSVLKSRFAELPVIPTANNIWYHFGTCFQRVNKKDLRSFAQSYVCRFRCTYKCLQSFSALKLFKEKTAHVLLISTSMDIMIRPKTNLQHDIEKMAFNIQPQNIAFYWVYAKIKKSQVTFGLLCIVSAEVSF